MLSHRPPFFDRFPWQHWGDQCPDQVALRSGLESLTWRELNRQIAIKIALLQQNHFRTSDKLLLCCGNRSTLDHLLLAMAVWQCGGQLLALNKKLPEEDRAAMIQSFNDPSLLIWTENHLSLVINHPHDIKPLRSTGSATWNENNIATLTLTSGSTGLPKRVAHRFSNHLYSALGLLEVIPFSMQESWLLSLPLFHVSGMSIVWRWLLRGAILQLVSTDWKQDLDLVTHASLVPTQLQQYLTYLSDTQKQPQLQHLLLGGAHIPVALTEQASAYQIQCWCGYGMTETASTVTLKKVVADNEDDHKGMASGNVGSLLPYRRLKIVDHQIYVAGETLATGYLEGATVKSILDSDGFFATKDSGEWKNGELIIHGRLDNCFISGGENLFPEQIEALLIKYPAVTQVVVIAKSDPIYGASPVAFIRCDDTVDEPERSTAVRPSLTTIAQLTQWMIEHALPHQRPSDYFLLPSHLLKQGLKISRPALKGYLEALEGD